ncbi:glycosyltransferase family protein [Desulfocastanea catecholica]
MNVSYYCQHVLGIGHFHRSVAICRAIARRHPTTLILGGPPVELTEPGIEVLRLPGLQMDREFNNMVPCQPGLSLAEVKTARQKQLFDHFQAKRPDVRPDVFITELYPFGRKAFRFELDPLLEAIRDGSLAPCSCYCSVRDILVEKKTGREKFEQRAVQTINDYFDGILVHADPEIITLETTFSRLGDIRVPLHYTGFVTVDKNDAANGGKEIREKLGLAPGDKLIVGSIGGGSVGNELLDAAIRAVTILQDSIPAHLQLFCGPYCDEATYITLQNSMGEHMTIDRFTDRFPAWLEAADLSISMAGYNTCMNLVQAGIPALVYPFQQNSEQRLRAARLGRKAPIIIIDETDLTPQLLAKKIAEQLEQPRMAADIKLNGATETLEQLERWQREQLHHD